MKLLTALRCVYEAYFKHSEWHRFYLAEKLCERIYPKYKFSEFGRTFLDDAEFLQEYVAVTGGEGFHCLDRKYALKGLVQLTRDIPGDTIECGVFKGASSYFICKAVAGSGKTHHLCDSFCGLSEPTAEDGAYWSKGDLSAQRRQVEHTLRGFTDLAFHEGWIPGCFAGLEDAAFSFAHIDVDLFQPTLDSLRFVYPRMRPGGVILFDDYGFSTCQGAAKAVDLFVKETGREPLIPLPTGQAFLLRR